MLTLPKEFNIDWKYFVNYGDNENTIQFCRKIDSRIAKPLFELPFIDTQQDSPVSLPERNMQRARTLKIPSGQEVAEKMKEKLPNLKIRDNKELGIDHIHGLQEKAPLWYYILKESELEKDGNHLGSVGGRIVGETLIGIVEATQKTLYPEVDFNTWLPQFGNNSDFTLKDLITYKFS